MDTMSPSVPVNPGPTPPGADAAAPQDGYLTFSDVQLAQKFKDWHSESFEMRHVFERQWLRNIWYILGRQWIYFDSKRGQWQDKRIAKNFPRPVTNIVGDIVEAVRADFAAINYGAMSRPIGNDNKNIVAATVADDFLPVLHDSHSMDDVLNEHDFWLLGCGNAFLHTAVEYKRENGVIKVAYGQCADCGAVAPDNAIADAGQKCPDCGSPNLTTAMNPDGTPKVDTKFQPKGVTVALSPFEIAFPLIYEQFKTVPYVIRMRWRTKDYYEQHPEPAIQALAKKLPFSKVPSDRTMQIFKALPFQNDLGMAPAYFSSGGTNSEVEGIVEYDVWVRPNEEFPDGAVLRFAGEASPLVIHSEMENVPGPLPYKDAQGRPLFTFTHARYRHVGGRVFGASIIDPIIPKQDLLNQVDAMMLMNLMRMANPVWLKPKGINVPNLASAGSTPGFVVEWDALTANGAKPERIDGANISAGYFQYRELLKQEMEELAGTYDILKGQKPAGVEAYAAMNLLVERGQARHASAFKSRGGAYKDWARFALEIEREFGPATRVASIAAPNKGWSLKTFQMADLGGDIEILIEDGSQTPKTALGKRAAISQLNSMRLLNPGDVDQVYKVYEAFGLTEMLPSLDAQKQEAWSNMEKFEQFLGNSAQVMAAGTTGKSPLVYRRWYDPKIHRQEFINWCVSDKGRAVLDADATGAAAALLDAYLTQIDMALQMAQAGVVDAGGQLLMPPPVGGAPGGQPPRGPGDGAAQAMPNSNRNAAAVGPSASGAGGTAAPTSTAS